MLICGISGEEPVKACVTPSGAVYEKSLLMKYVQEHQKDPVTNRPLSIEDVVEIKNLNERRIKIGPKATSRASIPGVLEQLHDEWDAQMTEMYEVRTALDQAQRELASAMYQMDAANRVIARLTVERDEARERLSTMSYGSAANLNSNNNTKKRGSDDGDGNGGDADAFAKKAKSGIPAKAIEVIEEKMTELATARKQRKVSDRLKSAEEISSFALLDPIPGHKANTQIHNLSILEDFNAICTAGADGSASIFEQLQKTSSIHTGHKKCLDVSFVGNNQNQIVTCGSDNTCKVWKSGNVVATYSEHTADVVSVSVHPSGQYFVSASSDASWHFHDLNEATTLFKANETDKYMNIKFHPDGALIAACTQTGSVQLWDPKVCSLHETLSNGGKNSAKSCAFSENGYYMAVSGDEGVKVWDLRKNTVVKDLETTEKCEGVSFDKSGKYLAFACGKTAKVYNVKGQWDIVQSFEVSKKASHCVGFLKDASAIVVGGADHNLRVFSN